MGPGVPSGGAGGAAGRTGSGRAGAPPAGPPRPRPSGPSARGGAPPGAAPVLRTFDSDIDEYASDGGAGGSVGGGRRGGGGGGGPAASGRRTPVGGGSQGGWPAPSPGRRPPGSGANSGRRGRPPKARPAGSTGGNGRALGGGGDDGGTATGAASPPLLLTWIQCEEAGCGKWRRLRTADVPDGPWVCAMHPDPRWAACAVPQAVPDDEIDRQLDAGVGLPAGPAAAAAAPSGGGGGSLAAHPAAASAGTVSPAAAAHAAACRRPPLAACTPQEFEADLAAFLAANGEGDLVRALRTRRITCNNSPLDVAGLYRAVVEAGGFDRNERYDEAGRWAGGINFAGSVFPRMTNYTPSHRATSVGNQLLANYRKFLLAYERAHAPVDLAGWPPLPPPPAGPHSRGGGPAGSGRAPKKPRPDPLAFLADVASAGEPPAPDGYARQAASAPPGAAAAAAAAAAARAGAPVAHAHGAGTGGAGAVTSAYGFKRAMEDDGQSGPSLFKRPRGPVDGPLPPPPGDAAAAAAAAARAPPASPALARQRSLDSAPAPVSLEAANSNVVALRRVEGGPGRAPPGALLLAPDPEDLNRHWPVLVAAARDLPLSVAAGGACRPPHFRASFPPTLADAVGGSPGGAGQQRAGTTSPALGDAYPVVVVGSRAMGWVEAASCRPFTGSAAAAAAAAVSPHAARRLAPVVADSDTGGGGGLGDETGGGGGGGGPPLSHPHDAADAECGRALKVASQYARSASGAEAGPAGRAGGRAMAHTAGAAAAGARLAALEARLPADGALFSSAFEFWAAWRRAVGRAEAAADLVPHVLALAAQLRPASLVPGLAGDALLAEVRALLDVTPPPGSPPGLIGGGGGAPATGAPAAAAAAAAAAASLAAATAADAGGPCTSATAAPPTAPGSPTSGSGGAAGGGGVPAVEAAIAAVEAAVDWPRLARPAGGPGGGLAAATPPRPPTTRSPLPPGAVWRAGVGAADLRHSGSATNLAGGGSLLLGGGSLPTSPAAPRPAGMPLAARAGSCSLPPAGAPPAAAPAPPAAPAAPAAPPVPATDGPSTPVGVGGSESPTAAAATAAGVGPPPPTTATTPPPQPLAPGTAAAVAKLFGDGAPAAAAAAAVAGATPRPTPGVVPATTPPQPRTEPLPVKGAGGVGPAVAAAALGAALNDTVSVGSADTARAAVAAAAAAGGRAELLESLRSMAESERAPP